MHELLEKQYDDYSDFKTRLPAHCCIYWLAFVCNILGPQRILSPLAGPLSRKVIEQVWQCLVGLAGAQGKTCTEREPQLLVGAGFPEPGLPAGSSNDDNTVALLHFVVFVNCGSNGKSKHGSISLGLNFTQFIVIKRTAIAGLLCRHYFLI